MTFTINNNWTMKKSGDKKEFACCVPCSVYKTLLENNVIPDPYYRENEYISTQISENDYTFSTEFDITDSMLCNDRIYLIFNGIDTIAEVFLNNKKLGCTNNMHRIYEYDVTDFVFKGKNALRVEIKSPIKYIEKIDNERHLWGVDSTMTGYTHIRKAHCMFGWDWGPKLPDMGIWRDVEIKYCSHGRINDVYY